MKLGSQTEVIAQHVHDGVSVERIRAAKGWRLAVADHVDLIAPPSADELRVLRDLYERTRIAPAGSVLSSPRKIPSATMANQE